MGEPTYRYTSYRISQMEEQERAAGGSVAPPSRIETGFTTRREITEHLAHIRQEATRLFAAHRMSPDHPLRQEHERLMAAAQIWGQSNGDFKADTALHAAFMEYNRTLHRTTLAAMRGNDKDLYHNLREHMGDMHDVRGDHTRRTMADNPILPTYGIGPDAFWQTNAPELYTSSGPWRSHSPDAPELRGGQVDPDRAWRTGMVLPEGLPRFTVADAGPPIANLNSPRYAEAPVHDPDAPARRVG